VPGSRQRKIETGGQLGKASKISAVRGADFIHFNFGIFGHHCGGGSASFQESDIAADVSAPSVATNRSGTRSPAPPMLRPVDDEMLSDRAPCWMILHQLKVRRTDFP